MIEVRQTEVFVRWLSGLRDQQAVARIVRRLRQVERGLLGDAKYFQGIGELRIDHGPGYRVYFVRRGDVVILLLCGGDKGTQRRDIAQALDMARDV
jgi:putative addiction module killer protein